MELALGDRAVAEEADRDVALAFDLRGERGARRDRQSAADDAVRAEHAHREVGDVHRAALAFAVAVDAPEQLGHHALHVRALGDAVAVAAVRAGHPIGVRQVGAHADGDGFLADIGVHGAVDLACRPQLDRELVELADQDHLAQHLDQVRCAHWRIPSGRTVQ